MEGFNIRDFIREGEMSESEIDYCEFWLSANRLVRETEGENFETTKITVNSTWNLEKLEEWLEGYEDKEVIKYLQYGWPLNAHNTETQQKIPRNQEGVRNNPHALKHFITKELKRGSIIGPFVKNPFGKHARISPLDTRPKKDSEELRVILNLSHPFESGSVNESIKKDKYTSGEDMQVKYPTTDDMARLVRKKGRKSKIFVRDLRKAYHQLWMSPKSIHLLGFIVENNSILMLPSA